MDGKPRRRRNLNIDTGIVQDDGYFSDEVESHIDGRGVTFVGPVGPEDRDRLLGEALASLHLTTIPERFGLAMAESMAAGTPVIGMDLGSVREVVADGETGYVVQSLDQAVEALGNIGQIDRAACRRRVEKLFSVEAMADGYLDAYRMILGEDRVHPAQ